MNDHIPYGLNSTFHCTMSENCWGVQCCADFTIEIVLLEDTISIYIPFMLHFDPCDYVLEWKLGERGETEHLFKEYSWGMTFHVFTITSFKNFYA